MNRSSKYLSTIMAGLLCLLIAFGPAPARSQSKSGQLNVALIAKAFTAWGTVIKITKGPAGESITVRDNATGKTYTTTRKGVLRTGGTPRIGETVFKNQEGQVAATQFPVRSFREERVATGHMRTDVTLSNTGRLDGKTRTWTSDELKGFEGGVVVAITDIHGNILWNTPVSAHKYGINGHSVPGAPSDRTEIWTETVPDNVLNNAAGVAIIQKDMPTNKLPEFLKEATQDAQLLAPLVTVVISIILAIGSL